MIEFAWPWAAAFLALPVIVWLVLPKSRQEEAALHVPFYSLAAGYESSASSQRRSWLRRLLMILGWIALVLACMRPQWVGEPVELPSTGRDLMLAVDISGSMGTRDMNLGGQAATRLQAVKAVVGDFVEKRKGDRLGLILFGTRPYVQTPLTFDRATVNKLLMDTPLGIAGGKTAIGDAIGLAVKRLRERPSKSRVLILLTDGRNNVGEVAPLRAAQIAAKEGIKIYTIGFGADQMEVPGLLFSRTVNPSADLDEATLKKIAQMTGGVYQRARSTRELASVYQELDRLEPIQQAKKAFRPTKSLFAWPLGFALVLSLVMGLTSPATSAWLYSLGRQQRAGGPGTTEAGSA